MDELTEEQKVEYKQYILGLLDQLSEKEQDNILGIVRGVIPSMRDDFKSDDESLSQFCRSIASMVLTLSSLPIPRLASTLESMFVTYSIAGAIFTSAYELPDEGEKPEKPNNTHKSESEQEKLNEVLESIINRQYM